MHKVRSRNLDCALFQEFFGLNMHVFHCTQYIVKKANYKLGYLSVRKCSKSMENVTDLSNFSCYIIDDTL